MGSTASTRCGAGAARSPPPALYREILRQLERDGYGATAGRATVAKLTSPPARRCALLPARARGARALRRTAPTPRRLAVAGLAACRG